MSRLNVSVLTFGAASQDVFLSGKILTAKRDVRSHDYVELFPLGAKAELENVVFDIGGGATNAAVTFARQGLHVGYVGKIGHDPAGAEVARVLKRENVDLDGIVYDDRLGTQYSSIMLAPNGERTILIYRGAAHAMSSHDVTISTLAADWFYISSLSGNLDLFKKLIKHAVANDVQVAFNPGGAEIAQRKKLLPLLAGVTVLSVNSEELEALFGGDTIRDNLRAAAEVCPYVVMTDGCRGVQVVHGELHYAAGSYQKVKVIDRTGAGDAFHSGFVAALALGGGVEDAITLASANSTSVVQHVGAKGGILRTRRVKRMKVKKSLLQP